MKTLPRLKAIFSLGAGVDGFLRDPEFPRHLPVVRFVDETLQREMAQYVTMHSLIIHRHQRAFDAAQTVYPTSTSHTITGPRLVSTADGEGVAVWTDIISGISVVRSVLSATRAAGSGTWSPAIALDGNTNQPGGPALTIDGSGNATAVWQNAVSGTLRYATHAHGGSFGACQEVHP